MPISFRKTYYIIIHLTDVFGTCIETIEKKHPLNNPNYSHKSSQMSSNKKKSPSTID